LFGIIFLVTVTTDARTGVVVRRYVQYALDLVLVVLLSVLVFALVLGAAILVSNAGVHGIWLVYVPFGIWVLTIFAGTLWSEIWWPHRRGGATPAMRWLGLRIVAIDGGTPSLRDYFVRWLMMVVDGMAFGLVGAVLIAATPRHQRLGDMVARTVVVRVT
jgi:uncharacterized RDD family membrane protein YckC